MTPRANSPIGNAGEPEIFGGGEVAANRVLGAGKATTIAAWYLVLSCAWVFGSDWLVYHFVKDQAVAAMLENAKGWVFVLVTAVLLRQAIATNFRHLRLTVQNIADSEARLQFIGDNLPDSYLYQYRAGPDGKPTFTHISGGVRRVHGLEASEVIRDSTCLLSQIEASERDGFVVALKDGAEESADFEKTLPIRRRDGERRLIHVRARPRLHQSGQVLWEGFATDVTAAKAAEHLGSQQKNLLAEMGHAAKVGGWELDPVSGEALWTEEVARIHDLDAGMQPTPARGLEFYPAQSRARLQAALQAAINQGTAYDLELEFVSAKGVRKWVRSTCKPILENGAVVRLRGSLQDITQQKAAELALRDSEQRLRLITETIDEVFWMADANLSRMLYVSAAYERIWGRSTNSLYADPSSFLQAIHPEDRPRVLAGLRVKDPGQIEQEYRIIRPDGSIRWILDRGFPLRDQSGQFTHYVGVAQDVTDRKLADLALRESEERFSRLFHASPSAKGISRLDDGRFLDVNEAFVRLYGYSRDEVVGRTSDELGLWHSENRAQIVQELREKRSTQRVELQGRRQDGTVLDLLASIQVLDLGGIACMVGSVVDITELKRAQAELRRSEAKWRSYIENAPVGVLVADQDGRHIEANRCAEEMLGYPTGSLLGTRVEDLPAPENGAALRRHIEELAREGRSVGQVQLRRQDGSLIWALAKATRLSQGQLLAIFQNISELKEAEAALQRSEQNYREIFNATNEAILLHDAATGIVLDVNQATLRLYGYDSREDVVSGGFQMLKAASGPYSLAEAQQRIRKAHERGQESFEWLAQKKNGEYFWAEVSLRGSQIGGQGRVLAVVRDITERRRAEQALRERERQLQIFVHHSPAAIAMFDRQMRYLVTSPRWLTDYRLKGQSLSGRSHYEVFPEVPERWKAIHQRCLNGAIEKCDADPFPRADGTLDWVRWEIRPWRTVADEIGGLIIFSELITEQKRAEAALRQSEENFRVMFEVASIGIAQADPHTGQWLRVNRTMCAITGYSEKELLQKKVSDLTHPDDQARDWELLQQVVRGELPDYHMEKRYLRKDGSVTWVRVNVTVLHDAAGLPLRTMATIEDISERKRTEEALRLRSAALEATANAIVITNRSGNIEWVNPAFTMLTGFSARDVIGQSTRLLRSGRHSPAFYKDLWDTIVAGKTWHNELINRRKDGTFYDEEMTVTPVRGPSGEISHFISLKQDITERKQLEAQFQQAQKMEAIGRLAGGVAHDFNNILAAMLMQAEMAAFEPNLSAEVRAALDQIRDSAQRAANLTRQLLLFSRKQVMQPCDLDLNEVVTSISRMLRRMIGEDIRLQLHLHSKPVLIHADAGMLDQIIMNLAVNARDAMPQGGQLLIETAEKMMASAAADRPAETMPGRYVRLTITDNGCGIPPEVLPRIFEPFFTTKGVGKGTGLGLATVFGIVKQHQGWIDVESQPGQGASFHVFLPAITALSPVKDQPRVSKPRGGRETILLVEDDQALRTTTRLILERHGYELITAADGDEALRLWEQRHDLALLLTDLVMPGGTSGQELARKLQAAKPGLKVIYASGYSADIAGRDIELRRGENFLQKPYPPSQLLDSIRRCLDA